MSAVDGGGAWLWSENSNATWYGNGWLWELRPIAELRAVYRIAALSAGRAAAIGMHETRSHAGTSKEAFSPNALALYEDEHWRVMPLSEALLRGEPFEVVAVGPRQFWLFGGAGQFAYFDGGALTYVPAPRFDVTSAHCGNDGTCFVAGSRPKSALDASITPASGQPLDATKPSSATAAANGPTATASPQPAPETLLFKVSGRSK